MDAAKKLHRKNQPTSKLSAEQIVDDLPRLKLYVLGCVKQSPGLTVSELALRFEERDPRRIGRRLHELEDDGLVKRNGARECRVTGRQAFVWEPVGGGQ